MTIQDLIDELQYVQREWGNDSPIIVEGIPYRTVTGVGHLKNGTILLKIATSEGKDGV